MRAREPDASGFVEREAGCIYWERFGDGDPALLFLCGDAIIDSRMWKAQIPWFARTHTVVTFDPRGNGRSDRPLDPAAYTAEALAAYAIAVLDAAGIERAVAIGLCSGAGMAVWLGADHPDRVSAVVAINPGLRLTAPHPHRIKYDFEAEPTATIPDGWAKQNRHYWLREWRDFVEFFFAEMLPEPHSSKQREDCVDWALHTTAETILADHEAPGSPDPEALAEMCRRVRCPVLVINGDQDQCQPPARSRRVAELTGGELFVLEGSGHLPNARDPVRVNLEISRFLGRVATTADV